MRPFTPRYIQQTANILSRPATLQFARTQPLNQTQQATMSSGLNIENTNIKTSPGVSLEDNQKTLVGCVLDLFAGRPSLEKLQLWSDEGVFEDPITIAQGRKQYEAQWVRWFIWMHKIALTNVGYCSTVSSQHSARLRD